jgi:aerobic carbon-monoxide dehydrogenase medium subunit
VKPASFTYRPARDVAEAVRLLAELGDGAKLLAGGQSLVPMMNLRLARPSNLIDITRIPGLSYLLAGPDGLRIGALTTHREVETTRDPAVLGGFGVLPRAARWIGHYPIRTKGTFGGSMAHADPASEWCLLAVLLGARVVLEGPAGGRVLPACDFFQGSFKTAAAPDEMITEVWFPEPAPRAALTEFAPRKGDSALAAAAVALDLEGDPNGPRCRSVRIVLGGVAPVPFTVDAAELSGRPASPQTWQAAGELAAAQISPPEDADGGASYARHLTATLVRRALAEAGRP